MVERARRRRMTRRGRLTLAALGAVAFLVGWATAQALRAEGPSQGAAEVAQAPPVSAGGSPPEPPAATRSRSATTAAPLAAGASDPPEWLLTGLPPGARSGEAIHSEWLQASLDRGGPLRERVTGPDGRRFEIEYTLDVELIDRVRRVLSRGRVALGHVLLLDPRDGRMLAYASTDPERFPADQAYPTASLMKVVTTSALLRRSSRALERSCVYVGNPYRLTRRLLEPPRSGRTASLGRALAMSNNQCFGRWGVHDLGAEAILAEMKQLGLFESPGPGHAAGSADPIEDTLDLGRLASGLGGSRIAPLAAARMAAALAEGELTTPRWVARVIDEEGATLPLAAPIRRRVWEPAQARQLRRALVGTTVSGTARRAFRGHRGRPLLDSIRVAGKTGSLSGHDPDGRYEWFIGVAPADDPRLAIATLVVNGELWWRSASQIAADVFHEIFCERNRCSPERADGFARPIRTATASSG